MYNIARTWVETKLKPCHWVQNNLIKVNFVAILHPKKKDNSCNITKIMVEFSYSYVSKWNKYGLTLLKLY